jgi:hypothetical protein
VAARRVVEGAEKLGHDIYIIIYLLE